MTTISSPSSFLFPHHATSFAAPENAGLPRPILPRPLKISGGPVPVSSTADRQKKRQRTNVTVACDSCKHARAKCDGQNPCERCGKRSHSCTYDHGNDRRSNRGTNEEVVAALSDRLRQYQKLVLTLRSSSTGDAGLTLQQLRSPSNDVASFIDGVTPASEDVAFAAAVGLLNETKTESLAYMGMEETTVLVDWVKQDLETTLADAPSLSKETSLDSQESNGSGGFSSSSNVLVVKRLHA
ncbi:hypothetical protein H2200_000931 [Cladophialophora chaetospira]|uniref:Zn(2)-C6 fungal-type domain-containing protein n=1 Tax=Cladophialophora chaetospira TaxID=386627 RepID=A0AA38XPE0_9EURO|nr:hypothetical protein H2200_000931 [Cladophialophora chaetospira]